MTVTKRKFAQWNLNKCVDSAKTYKGFREWREHEVNAYNISKHHGWIDLIRNLFPITIRRERRLHTLDSCIASALKFEDRKTWFMHDRLSYNYASKKGWLKYCTAHMMYIAPPYTKEDCKLIAAAFESRDAWYIAHKSTYNAATKNSWLAECTEHMGSSRKPGRKPRQADAPKFRSEEGGRYPTSGGTHENR